MKELLVIMLFICCNATTFSQSKSIPDSSVQAFALKSMQKSKTQKTVAWVLLGSGAAMTIGGILKSRDAAEEDPFGTLVGANEDANDGVLISSIGLLSMAGSIPLFIASARNKRKTLSATIKYEDLPVLQQKTIVHTFYPAISIKYVLAKNRHQLSVPNIF